MSKIKVFPIIAIFSCLLLTSLSFAQFNTEIFSTDLNNPVLSDGVTLNPYYITDTVSSPPENFYIQGQYLFFEYQNHIVIWDVTIPSSPSVVNIQDWNTLAQADPSFGTVSTVGSPAILLTITDGYMSVATNVTDPNVTITIPTIHIFDVSNPLTMSWIPTYSISGFNIASNECAQFQKDIITGFTYLYIAGEYNGISGLHIFDVTNRSYCSGIAISSVTTLLPLDLGILKVAGNYAYVTLKDDGIYIYIYDISNKFLPVFVNSQAAGYADNLNFQGTNILWISNFTDPALGAIEVINPNRITILNQGFYPGTALGLSYLIRMESVAVCDNIIGMYLYDYDISGIVTGDPVIYTLISALFDITDPSAPLLLGTLDTLAETSTKTLSISGVLTPRTRYIYYKLEGFLNADTPIMSYTSRLIPPTATIKFVTLNPAVADKNTSIQNTVHPPSTQTPNPLMKMPWNMGMLMPTMGMPGSVMAMPVSMVGIPGSIMGIPSPVTGHFYPMLGLHSPMDAGILMNFVNPFFGGLGSFGLMAGSNPIRGGLAPFANTAISIAILGGSPLMSPALYGGINNTVMASSVMRSGANDPLAGFIAAMSIPGGLPMGIKGGIVNPVATALPFHINRILR